MLVKRYGLQLPQELTDKHFLGAIAAFTQLCNRYLGTEVDVTGGKELANTEYDSKLSTCEGSV